jgi:cell division protein FtsW
MMVSKVKFDWVLFVLVAALALFGAAMVYSASAMIALRESQSQFTYFYKQFAFTLAGLAGMFIVSKIDYRRYQHPAFVYGFLALTVVFLIAVFAFPAINGARRWIRFAGLSFQPSEMAKLALPVFLAFFLARREQAMGELKSTVIPCVACLLLLGGLVFLEPDLGTVIVLCSIFSAVYFAAGARLLHIATVAAAMVVAGIGAIVLAPWRVQRMMAFLDPFNHADDAGYQVVQSLMTLGSGGIFGEGFAKGQGKLFYLPYPYSDFIFSVVGEEFGLIGTLGIVAAFGVLLWRGARASLRAPDRFGMLLGIGVITGITVQALFNISVVISIVPAKGIPLPFISYGGTSVLMSMLAVGVLLNISQSADKASSDYGESGREAVRARRRRK